MAILSKKCKPMLTVNLSLNQTLLTFLLSVRQTWWLNSFWQFLCEGLSSFNPKRSYLAVYVKEGLPFAWDLSLENSADSYLCFQLALHHLVSCFFFLYRSPSLSLSTVFDFYFIKQKMRFFRSAHLLISLSLETLMPIIRTG